VAYQVCGRDLFDGICLVGLGVDGPVICDRIDLVFFSTNLRNCVFWSLLKLLNKLVHDIYKDDL